MSSITVRSTAVASACAALLHLGLTAAADQEIDQHQAADPTGTVEIVNVAGAVNVTGWDKSEVEASGRFSNSLQHVEVTGGGGHTLVRVAIPEDVHGGADGSGRLTVHVPAHSNVEVSAVTADLTVTGVSGMVRARTVSGAVKADGAGSVRINTVSGDVSLQVKGGDAEIQTMSGDVILGGAGGNVSITSVSGDGKLTLGTLHSFRLSTVSGDFTIAAQLEPTAQFEAQSISGDLKLNFSGAPPTRYNLQTLGGDIKNCTAPEAARASYGPGSNLVYTTGGGTAQVQASSKTGDLDLCAR